MLALTSTTKVECSMIIAQIEQSTELTGRAVRLTRLLVRTTWQAPLLICHSARQRIPHRILRIAALLVAQPPQLQSPQLQGLRAQAPRASTSPFAPRPSTSPAISAISGSDASEVFFSPSESVPESPPLESPGGECPPPAASPVGDAVEEEE